MCLAFCWVTLRTQRGLSQSQQGGSRESCLKKETLALALEAEKDFARKILPDRGSSKHRHMGFVGAARSAWTILRVGDSEQ